MNEMPLDKLPTSGRPSLRQQVAAAQQVVLWLAARACLKRDSLRAAGSRLGAGRSKLPAAWTRRLRRWQSSASGARSNTTGARGQPPLLHWAEMIDVLDSKSRAGRKSVPAAIPHVQS